jgi:hypothetical protein
MNTLDRTAKRIIDILADACHVPIRDICVLTHDNDHFKAYVHGTGWYKDNTTIANKIVKAWDVNPDNISIGKSPKPWWVFGSTGYVIEVKYE